MLHSVEGNPRRYKSRPRGAGVRALRVVYGAASDESAKKLIDYRFQEAERVAELLTLNGDPRRVLLHLERLDLILEAVPAPSLTDALRSDGHASRQQDEAREACCLDGATPAELDRLELRTRREMAASRVLLAAIKAARR